MRNLDELRPAELTALIELRDFLRDAKWTRSEAISEIHLTQLRQGSSHFDEDSVWVLQVLRNSTEATPHEIFEFLLTLPEEAPPTVPEMPADAEVIRSESIPATTQGEEPWEVSIWCSEPDMLGLDIERGGERLYSANGFRAGMGQSEDSVHSLVSYCDLAVHQAAHDDDDAPREAGWDVEAFSNAVHCWRTVDHFEQGEGNRSHLRKVWIQINAQGDFEGDHERDISPAIFVQHGSGWDDFRERLIGNCADETDDDPMGSLDRGWPVPFWITDEELDAYLYN